ncbi:hypothetical protein HDV62DRAFT_159705 [Trichoderma sp. SZMC 28011]
MHKQDSAHAWAHGDGTSNVRTYEAPSLPLSAAARQVPYSVCMYSAHAALAVPNGGHPSPSSVLQRLCSGSGSGRLRGCARTMPYLHPLALLHQAKVPPSSYLRPAHCCCRPTGTSSQVLDPPHFPPLHHTTPCPHHSHFQSHSSIPEEYICIPLPSLHLSTASRQPHQLSPSTTLLSFQGIAKTLVNSFYNNS